MNFLVGLVCGILCMGILVIAIEIVKDVRINNSNDECAEFVEITTDKSGILHEFNHTSISNYRYLTDTGVVYYVHHDGNGYSYTPVISSNGYFLMYDDEALRVSEIKN
jgi:hypothetical protein